MPNPVARVSRVFVGRRTELAQLKSLLNQAAQGRGAVVLVEGEVGVGKTRLVNQFFHEIRQEITTVITAAGDCTAIGGHSDAFLPFRQILAKIATTDEKDGILAKGKHLDFIVKVAPAWIALIPIVGGPAAAVIRTALEAHETYFEKPQDERKERMFEQFSQVLQHLGQKNVLVLFIDDLQWADSASVSLLFHIARNISTYRLLLICAYRPSDIEVGVGERYAALKDTLYEMQRYGLCTKLPLGHLNEDQVREMVDLEFPGNRFPAEFAQTLYKRSGGNALFVTHFLISLSDEGAVDRNGMGWYLTKSLASLEIPREVESVLGKRLNRLTTELRDLCECASVEGVDFTYEVVAKILKREFKRSGVEIGRQVRVLQGVHRLIQEKGEKRLSSGQVLHTYSFDHGLVQEILYNDLSPGQRQEYHKLVGAALERSYVDDLDAIAPQLAIHFEQGKQFGKAGKYYYVSGMAAHHLGATTEAVYSFQKGIDLLGVPATRDRHLRLLADCYQGLAHAHSTRMGQFDKGITLYGQCLRIRERLPDQEEYVLQCLHMIGVCYRGLEQFVKAREYYEQALRLAVENQKQASQGNILRDIGTTYYLEGDLDTAVDYFQRSLELLSGTEDEGGIADTLRRLGNVYQKKGQPEKAKELYEEALQIHRALKRLIHEMMLHRDMSALAFQEGRDEEGFMLAQIAREIGEKHAFYHQLSETLRFIAQKHLEREQFAQAFSTYAEAAAVSYACNPYEHSKTIAEVLRQVRELRRKDRTDMASQFCHVLLASWRDQGLDRRAPESMSLWQKMRDSLQTAQPDADLGDLIASLKPTIKF